MSDNFYTTKTAALKATKGDIRNLNAKQIKLNDKNILDYISDSEFNSYDSRDPQLKNDELDLWNTEISLSDNNHIEVKPYVHSMLFDSNAGITLEGITESQIEIIRTAVKVIDNEVLGENDEHIMYWQTNGAKDMFGIFSDDSNLESFSSDLSNLTIGYGMFQSCHFLESFSSDLSNLTMGMNMFYNCYSLTSFPATLPSLTHGGYMFRYCNGLTTFTSDLPSLTDGTYMFGDCGNLTSFSSDLSSLYNGGGMFYNCDNLTSFSSDLSSLADGYLMFYDCKLDAQSVANIVHTLHQRNNENASSDEGNMDIGIGCDNTEADQLLFAQECHCDTWQELLDEFSAKNWTVTFQCNGRPTEATTYNMRRGATLPLFAKVEEVIMPTDEKARKPHYSHTSLDGSKFYRLTYFHSTNGSTDGYTQFNSIEEAEQTFEITPKQQIEK